MKQAEARALVAAGPSIFPDIWPKVEAIRAAMPELRVFRVGGPLTDREQIDILQ